MNVNISVTNDPETQLWGTHYRTAQLHTYKNECMCMCVYMYTYIFTNTLTVYKYTHDVTQSTRESGNNPNMHIQKKYN